MSTADPSSFFLGFGAGFCSALALASYLVEWFR
jgi:hypothetical protein